MPRVSVVIPTWNGAALLADALRSLETQDWRDFEIIVVDNGSEDDTQAMLDREFDDVRRIRFDENRGFSAAVNAGIDAARGDVIVLMNNDTEADPQWLAALVMALDEHPEVGSCASKMLDFVQRDRIDGAGDEMSPTQASTRGRGEPDGPVFSDERYVFSACAGAAAYRREMLDEIGIFDERFFAYLEDVDLGFRAQIAGYRCLYVPGAVIYHRGGATSDRVSDTRRYWLTRNSLFLFFQNMPGRIVWRHGWFMLLWPFADALLHHRSLRIAVRSWLAFCADIPAVISKRRRAYAIRRTSDAELISMLSPRESAAATSDAESSRSAARVGEARE